MGLNGNVVWWEASHYTVSDLDKYRDYTVPFNTQSFQFFLTYSHSIGNNSHQVVPDIMVRFTAQKKNKKTKKNKKKPLFTKKT